MAFNESCCFSEADEVRQYSAANSTWQYCTPIIVLLGTVGNSLSLVVLQQAKMKRNVLAKQLTALAASNLLILYFTLLVKYLIYVQNVSLTDNLVACKMIHWLSEPLGEFNSWLMVAITTERLIAVMKPLQMRASGRVINAKKQIFFIAILFLFLNSHILYGRGHEYQNKTNGNETLISKCGFVSTGYKEFYSYWVVIEILLLFYLPVLFLFIGNIAIVLKLKNRYSNRTLFKVSKSSTVNRLGLRAMQTLALVLLLNTGFIFCTAPISILFFIYEPWDVQNSSISSPTYTISYAIANMVMYAKYSIGFLFFTVISDFRSELCQLLRFRKRVDLINKRMFVFSLERLPVDTNVSWSKGTLSAINMCILQASRGKLAETKRQKRNEDMKLFLGGWRYFWMVERLGKINPVLVSVSFSNWQKFNKNDDSQ